MDYTARYGLEFNPFIKNAKEIYVETPEFKELRFRLNYLLSTRGFGLLTDSPGRGKTTAIRSWAASLTRRFIKSFIPACPHSPSWNSIGTWQLDSDSSLFTENLRTSIIYRMRSASRLVIEKRITPVIIIDEANYISGSVLNDLKILFNFEMDSRDRAVVLLAGLPQLNNTLRLGIHEPLRQRIVMNYDLEGLSKEDGRLYIQAKLEGAGCHQPVFEENAIEAILNAANGTPRLINKLCNASLLIGNSSTLNIITADAVMKAISDCELG